MNYIKRLQADNAEQAERIARFQSELRDFRAFLQSSKFTESSDGERVDWISTGDAIRWIDRIWSDFPTC